MPVLRVSDCCSTQLPLNLREYGYRAALSAGLRDAGGTDNQRVISVDRDRPPEAEGVCDRILQHLKEHGLLCCDRQGPDGSHRPREQRDKAEAPRAGVPRATRLP